jgi:hypothetical protein
MILENLHNILEEFGEVDFSQAHSHFSIASKCWCWGDIFLCVRGGLRSAAARGLCPGHKLCGVPSRRIHVAQRKNPAMPRNDQQTLLNPAIWELSNFTVKPTRKTAPEVILDQFGYHLRSTTFWDHFI